MWQGLFYCYSSTRSGSCGQSKIRTPYWYARHTLRLLPCLQSTNILINSNKYIENKVERYTG